MPSPDFASLAVQAGIETVIPDMEHGFPSLTEVKACVANLNAVGGRCMVRVGPGMVNLVGPLADLGVHGLILSGARSVADIKSFIAMGRFPPEGRRSLNPFVEAAPTPGDVNGLNGSGRRLELWAMAETRDLRTELMDRGPNPIEGLSGLLVGPYDLANDLGLNPVPDEADLLAAVEDFAKWAQSSGAAWSLFVRDAEALGAWQNKGLQPSAVVLGYDRDVWFSAIQQNVASAKSGVGSTP
ncbi:MAG: aldolase/citrate lyase family protein [Acidimicrobiia bacterium]